MADRAFGAEAPVLLAVLGLKAPRMDSIIKDLQPGYLGTFSLAI